jgi:hypothetical protein
MAIRAEKQPKEDDGKRRYAPPPQGALAGWVE